MNQRTLSDIFAGERAPTKDERESAVASGLIVLDTNVLLSVYAQAQSGADEWFDILDHVQSRLWIPYQVGMEFWKQRAAVAVEASDTKKALGTLRAKASEFETILSTWMNRLGPTVGTEEHELLSKNLEAFREAVEPIMSALDVVLRGHERRHSIDASEDDIVQRLNKILTEKNIGEERTAADHEHWQRDFNKDSPGWSDSAKNSDAPQPKSGDAQFGDFYIWQELKEYVASLEARGEAPQWITFVTGDSKTDWWESITSPGDGPGKKGVFAPGDAITARKPLVREIREVSHGQTRYVQMRPWEFMATAATVLHVKVSEQTLTVAKSDADSEVLSLVLRVGGKNSKRDLAQARWNVGGSIRVFAGSMGRRKASDAFSNSSYSKLRDDLIDKGILRVDSSSDKVLILTQDFEFSSLSAAAVVLLAAPTVAKNVWHLTDTGETLAEFEERGLAAVRDADMGDEDLGGELTMTMNVVEASPMQRVTYATGNTLLVNAQVRAGAVKSLVGGSNWQAGPIEFDIRANERNAHIHDERFTYRERAEVLPESVRAILLSDACRAHLITDFDVPVLIDDSHGHELHVVAVELIAPMKESHDGPSDGSVPTWPAILVVHVDEQTLPYTRQSAVVLHQLVDNATARVQFLRDLSLRLETDVVHLLPSSTALNNGSAELFSSTRGAIYPVVSTVAISDKSTEQLHPKLSDHENRILLTRELASAQVTDNHGSEPPATRADRVDWTNPSVLSKGASVGAFHRGGFGGFVLGKGVALVAEQQIDESPFYVGRLYLSAMYIDVLAMSRLCLLVLADLRSRISHISAASFQRSEGAQTEYVSDHITPRDSALLQQQVLAFATLLRDIPSAHGSMVGQLFNASIQQARLPEMMEGLLDDVRDIVGIAESFHQQEVERRNAEIALSEGIKSRRAQALATFVAIFSAIVLPSEVLATLATWWGWDAPAVLTIGFVLSAIAILGVSFWIRRMYLGRKSASVTDHSSEPGMHS